MKIALVNARHNTDLGDAVVAECIDYALRSRLPDANIFSCDLSGRKSVHDRSTFLQTIARNVLPITPDAVKKTLYAQVLVAIVRSKLLPHYDKTINGANLAIFGGGDIFTDTDQHFPLKIAAAASIVRDRNIPIAIHAVGVGPDWSAESVSLFNEAFAGADICWTSVRDDLSRNRWRRQFRDSDVPAPNVTMDPGLLAGKAFAPTADASLQRRNRPLIGLCVTDPSTLRAQSDGDGAAQFAPGIDFYKACIKALGDNDCDVLLFTNGAAEDEALLHRSVPAASIADNTDGALLVAKQSKTPAELVETIRRCDAVVGCQLYASIIAHALKIPHVGVAASPMLNAFFDMVSRRDFLLGPNNATPKDIAAAVARALETPIGDSAHALIVNRVERDFDELARILQRAADGKRPVTASAARARRARAARR